MLIRYLGWAGAEIEAEQGSLVIDPLDDPLAVFAFLGEKAKDAVVPGVAPPTRAGQAVAGLVTHLHRDHADAAALTAALRPGAPVLEPVAGGGEGLENLGLAQAEHELAESGLQRRRIDPWQQQRIDPFEVTALPAVDGSGDPQLSWLVHADGIRVLHLGDTLFHGFWWRMALRHGPFDLVLAPVNGAVLDVPHRQPNSPLPAAMDPEQAAVAVAALGARMAVPIHYGGLDLDPLYTPLPEAEHRFADALAGSDVEARIMEPGEELELAAEPVA